MNARAEDEGGVTCERRMFELRHIQNIEEAKEIIGNHIGFCNRKRPHSGLNCKTPIEFERGLAII